jgi:hypothetical protein
LVTHITKITFVFREFHAHIGQNQFWNADSSTENFPFVVGKVLALLPRACGSRRPFDVGNPMTLMSVCALTVAFAAATISCSSPPDDTQRAGNQPAVSQADSAASKQAGSAAGTVATRPPLTAEEKQFYRDMARSAWTYLDTYYQSATGFVNATPDWANTTLWDVGGQVLAFLAARELGLLDAAEYQRRMTQTLTTLEKLPLYKNAALNKLYSTKELRLGDGSRAGWSATDLGRFFLALKILAKRDSSFAAQAERIVRRNDFSQIVKNGYLYGQGIGSSGKPWVFQEGRIGYEQYVAKGFSEWGADVRNALDVKKNAQPVDVMGVKLLADRRQQDRLLSEPFILYGIELGLSGDMRDLASNVLKVQEARFTTTGKVTMATEDAVSVPPDYFYYYCVYCNRKPFVIDLSVPGRERDKPRWVSTKAAFGWHALMPNDYTKKAIEFVMPAKDPKRGWASGVMEDNGASTKTFDINTAAVLLEIAYYQLRGGIPLIEPGPVLP